MSNGYVSSMRKGIGTDKLENVLKVFPELSRRWLIYEEGPMIIVPDNYLSKIPLYDDDSVTIGGRETDAVTDGRAHVAEWIDAGDWFPQATAAIHHYGDSMTEYPSGSILVLRRVKDQTLLINGQNYVIETDEYRVTKKITDEGDYLMAYSTNRETYPDGALVHKPFRIPKASIRHMDLVIGCVLKEFANKPIPIK